MEKRATLPSGWMWTTIENISIAQSGSGFPKNLQGSISGDFPFIKVSDITNAVNNNGGLISIAKNYLNARQAKQIGARVFPIGTTLFAKIGEAVRLNRRALATTPLLADNNVMGLIPRNNVTPRYLYYFLHTIDLYEYSQATTVPSVRKTDVTNISVPLPPLPVQERIVERIESLFTQLDAGVAGLKRAKAALKRYKASLLKAACEGRLVPQDPNDEPAEELLKRILAERGEKFTPPEGELGELPRGWCWARPSQLCDSVNCGSTPSSNLMTTGNGEIPFIKVYNLTFDGDLDFSKKPTFISYKTHNSLLSRSKVYPGDVLTNIVGPPLGKVSIVPNTYFEWNINQAIVAFHTGHKSIIFIFPLYYDRQNS